MKHLFPTTKAFIVCFLIFAAGDVFASEAVGRTGLDAWSLTGARSAVDSERLTIPQGSQIARAYRSSMVRVDIVTRPYFGSRPSEWATVEVGPTSLSFVRDAKGGGVVLLGDVPLSLPFGLPLDPEGRSEVPLELSLEFDSVSNSAVLRVFGESFDTDARAVGRSIEVALSSGGSVSWEIDSLEVHTSASSKDGVSDGDKSTEGKDPLVPPSATLRNEGNGIERRQAIRDARTAASEGELAAAEKFLSDTTRNPRNSAEWHLETANSLVQLAFAVSRMAKPQAAVTLSGRALTHVEMALRKAARNPGSNPIEADAHALAGFVYERLLAEPDQAVIYYHQASLRRPADQPEAALTRMQQIKNEHSRSDSGKGQ